MPSFKRKLGTWTFHLKSQNNDNVFTKWTISYKLIAHETFCRHKYFNQSQMQVCFFTSNEYLAFSGHELEYYDLDVSEKL